MTTAPTVRLLLRLEGLSILVGAVYLYAELDFSWLAFGLLFLAPDLGMLGYLVSPKVGSICYNALHTYLLPVLLGAVGLLIEEPVLIQLALIIAAHIGFDRLLGYGLKHAESFQVTHLGAIGREKA